MHFVIRNITHKIVIINLHHRGIHTGSQALHPQQTEHAILRHLPWLNSWKQRECKKEPVITLHLHVLIQQVYICTPFLTPPPPPTTNRKHQTKLYLSFPQWLLIWHQILLRPEYMGLWYRSVQSIYQLVS